MTVNLSGLVEISISTKDRWVPLHKTLRALRGFGLGDLRIILADDGSAEQCPFEPVEICPGVELHRFEESAGYIVRRNQIMQIARAPFVLQLDDDSYPVDGSLSSAVAVLRQSASTLALTFPLYNPLQQADQITSLYRRAYQTRSYIGCAALINRRSFLELGGYRDELVHFAEEIDLAARGFLQGSFCYHYPELLFHHEETVQARNWERMDYYGARNLVLWTDWFVPAPERLLQQARNTWVRLRMSLPNRRAHLKGHLAGLRSRARWRANRRRMSRAQYRQWLRLPTY